MTSLFLYDPEALAEERRSMGGGLAAMCENTAKRVRSTGYLEFGPYWWAVKRILNANGYEFGPADNAYMADRFTVSGDDSGALTLVAAWRAADEIRNTYFKGANTFPLDDMGDEEFSLFDPDMEAGE